MVKIRTKIELTEKDLAEIVAEKYGLKNATISIYKYDGDPREPSYTSITIEGEQQQRRIVFQQP